MPEPNGKLYELLLGKLARVKHHGEYFSALCPFHDDSKPSLLVYIDGFTCLGCRRTGSLPALWNKVSKAKLHADNIQALPPVSPSKFPDLPLEGLVRLAHSTLIVYTDLQDYLKLRRIDSRIEPNELGWYDGWFTIPVLNPEGDYASVVLRAGPSVEAATHARYLSPPHLPPTLYVPDWNLLARATTIYLVYGMFDALTMSTLRVPCVTGTHGLRVNPLWLASYRARIVVIPDDSPQEREAASDLVSQLGWRGKALHLRYPSGCKDPSDMHRHGYADLLLSQL